MHGFKICSDSKCIIKTPLCLSYRASCRMCGSCLTPRWRTSCWVEIVRSPSKVRTSSRFSPVQFPACVMMSQSNWSCGTFQARYLADVIRQPFTCNALMHSACVLLEVLQMSGAFFQNKIFCILGLLPLWEFNFLFLKSFLSGSDSLQIWHMGRARSITSCLRKHDVSTRQFGGQTVRFEWKETQMLTFISIGSEPGKENRKWML